MRTEKQKMLSGDLYIAADPELVAERKRCRQLTRRLNSWDYEDRAVYQAILAELMPNAQPNVWIEPPFYCDYGYNVYAGAGVFMNFNCVILDVMPVRIGDGTMFGPNVQVYTATHPIDAAERTAGPEYARPITIGRDCWIGGSAVISPGVTIGDRVIVGAGAVVTKDVPDDTIVVGNPARPLGCAQGDR
jgi:maltose O-acetyltransferase